MSVESVAPTSAQGPLRDCTGSRLCGTSRGSAPLSHATVRGRQDAFVNNVLETPRLHYGVVCDACDQVVQGFRFKCLNCADYDLCGSCHRQGIHLHHEFEFIPYPRTNTPAAFICKLCNKLLTDDERHKCLEEFYLCGTCSDRHPHDFRPGISRRRSAFTTTGGQNRRAPAVSTSATSQKERLVIHENVWCDSCDKVIVGTRFKCGNCEDFDLCNECEAKTDHDRGHVFLKIRVPVGLNGVGALLPPIYGPGIRQKARHARAAWSAEGDAAVDCKGTETIALELTDQATGTEQLALTTTETQTSRAIAVQQKSVQTMPSTIGRSTSLSSLTGIAAASPVNVQLDDGQASLKCGECASGRVKSYSAEPQNQGNKTHGTATATSLTSIVCSAGVGAPVHAETRVEDRTIGQGAVHTSDLHSHESAAASTRNPCMSFVTEVGSQGNVTGANSIVSLVAVEDVPNGGGTVPSLYEITQVAKVSIGEIENHAKGMQNEESAGTPPTAVTRSIVEECSLHDGTVASAPIELVFETCDGHSEADALDCGCEAPPSGDGGVSEKDAGLIVQGHMEDAVVRPLAEDEYIILSATEDMLAAAGGPSTFAHLNHDESMEESTLGSASGRSTPSTASSFGEMVDAYNAGGALSPSPSWSGMTESLTDPEDATQDPVTESQRMSLVAMEWIMPL